MATCGIYLHMRDDDKPEIRLLPSGAVTVTIDEASVFLTTATQAQALADAFADAAAALMLAQEIPGTDETPEG